MRKFTRISVAAVALMMTVIVPFGTSAQAASYSSKNVTLVNANKKASKKSVKKVQITSPALKKGKLTIYRGTKNVTVQLKTKVTVAGKNVTSKTKKYNAVSYKSSKASVVSVSSTGKLTAKKNGTATITVTSAANSKKKATVKVTVKSGVSTIKATVANKTSTTIKVGQTKTINTTIKNAAKGANKTVTYSSSNKKVATVSSKGKIKAISAGTATITVAPKYGTGVSAKIKVTVPAVLPTSIKANPTSVALVEGNTAVLGYTVAPSTTTNKAVSFGTNNAAVATVDSTGKVTAVKEGTAIITIQSKAKSSIKATVTVTVSKAPVVVVLPSAIQANDQELLLGETKAIATTVAPANAANKAVTYKSANEAIATVDANGIITAKKAGETKLTITAVADTRVSKEINVKVNDWNITIGNAQHELSFGKSADLNINVVAAAKVSYTTDNNAIAYAADGKVYAGSKRGSAQITVTATIGSVAKTATANVKVFPANTKLTLADITKTEFATNRKITVENPKELLDQVNELLQRPDVKNAIKTVDIKATSHKVVVDGTEFEVTFDGTKVAVLKNGNAYEVSSTTKVIESITVVAPEGKTVNEYITEYIQNMERVQFLVGNMNVACNITIGSNKITKIGFTEGYVTVTINGSEFQAFVMDGTIRVVGDHVANDMVKKLIEKGYVANATLSY